MRVFKTRLFAQWAKKIKLHDSLLKRAIEEVVLGQYEANLGGYLIKKRIAIGDKGKSGSFRTIIAFKKEDKAFFVYGYAKNAKSNISPKEIEVYKKLASILVVYQDDQLECAITNKKIIEVL